MGLGIGRKLKRSVRKVTKGIKRGVRKLEKGTKTGLETTANRAGEVAMMPVEKVVGALTPEIPDIPEPEKQAVMPIPDEELSRSARRRARARRKGGRSSSILTGGDSLGGY